MFVNVFLRGDPDMWIGGAGVGMGVEWSFGWIESLFDRIGI
jgi:hypothetical protein